MSTEITLSQRLAKAALDRCTAEISDGTSRLHIYFANPVAIGEHPQHHEEIDKLLDQIAAAEDRACALRDYFPELLTDHSKCPKERCGSKPQP